MHVLACEELLIESLLISQNSKNHEKLVVRVDLLYFFIILPRRRRYRVARTAFEQDLALVLDAHHLLDDLAYHTARRPYVGLLVIRLILKYQLRRPVVPGETYRRQRPHRAFGAVCWRLIFQRTRESEVAEFYRALLRDQNVGGFQIAVDDVGSVQELHREEQIVNQCLGLILVDSVASRQEIAEVEVEKLHDQVDVGQFARVRHRIWVDECVEQPDSELVVRNRC